MEFYIDEGKHSVITGSLSIEDSISERATASFTVEDLQNQYDFYKGMSVRIEDGGNLVYRGFVEMSRKQPITDTGQYLHQIDCTDMHYLADKRIVALAETSTTAGSLVGTIVDRYLESEGVNNTLKYWADYETNTWNEVIS